jgi:tetratricopeptide (TPR) repeat protein
MTLLATIFSRIYRYTTIMIVVGSPLLFIPKIGFPGDITYHIAMVILAAIAIVAYVANALITKTWHTVSRLEFLGYFAFTLAVIGSTVFSKSPIIMFFGDGFNQYSAAAYLTLPAVMYLVRSLPEALRHKLKLVTLGLLGASAFVFVTALIIGGFVLDFAKVLFAGFSSTVSFAAYLGLFTIALFFYVRKGKIQKKYKLFIFITGCLFVAWAATLSTQNSIRPNVTSTLLVGKNVLVQDGIFGVGPGNFSRAWQLYRPQDVVNSQYFGYEFVQGSDTFGTIFVTLGITGFLTFLLLVLSSVYSTFISYRQNKDGQDHIILGLLSLTLVYFCIIAFLVPLSYAMLVMWMVVGGLGIAKAHLTEFHPSKKLVFVFAPIALLLVINAAVTINKTRAFVLYNKAQSATSIEEAQKLIDAAAKLYSYDGFYRLKVEYAVTANRNLVASNANNQEEMKNAYLVTAQQAVNDALKAVEINPNNYQNHVSLGRAYELAVPFDKEGGFNNAKKAYADAAVLYPGNPYLYVMQARLEISAGTKDGVRASLTEALKKKQNFADALYLMSQLEASDNKIEEAIAYAVEAVKNAPNDPLVYTQAGLLFYAKKDYQNAIAALRAGLEKDPNNQNIAYFLILSLRDSGRPDLAQPLAEELLRRNPGNEELGKVVSSLTSTPVTATDENKSIDGQTQQQKKR